MTKKWSDDELTDAGVVKGKSWPAIVAGACGVGAALIALIVYFL